jgi:hypothetical protein
VLAALQERRERAAAPVKLTGSRVDPLLRRIMQVHEKYR